MRVCEDNKPSEVRREISGMPYYVLQRDRNELYAMGMLLSEEEAWQYGTEGQRAMVKAILRLD